MHIYAYGPADVSVKIKLKCNYGVLVKTQVKGMHAVVIN